MKIIVALDSFKDCLGSEEAGMAVGRGILSADPDAEVVMLPMADGGRGHDVRAEALSRRGDTDGQYP